MDRVRDRFHFSYIIIDFLCLAVAFYTSYLWRYNPGFWNYLFIPYKWGRLNLYAFSEYTSIFIVWSAISLFSLQRLNLFKTDRDLSIPRETWQVLKALVLAAIPTAAAIFLLKFKVYSRFVFISSWIIALILLILWRVCKRVYIRHRLRKGLGLIRVLIVGTGPVTESILNEIRNHVFTGFSVVGILSKEKRPGDEMFGIKVLGGYKDLKKVVREYFIDEVFVGVDLSSEEMEGLVLIGKELGCGMKIISRAFEQIYGDLKTYNLGYMHFLEYGLRKLHGTELFIKRLFDIIGAIILLLVFGPASIIIALLIKIEDGGQVFYISRRMGMKGRVFNFYKFRSMIKEADKIKENLRGKSEVLGPIFKIRNDPRITRVGRFIRRWSLDELPQLWNVLKAEMSLVGPRPPVPEEVEKYDLWQKRRLEVKPGITCMWQIRGRSNLGFYKWVKWDLWYIDNWSFWLDIRILILTIPAVIKGEGAY